MYLFLFFSRSHFNQKALIGGLTHWQICDINKSYQTHFALHWKVLQTFGSSSEGMEEKTNIPTRGMKLNTTRGKKATLMHVCNTGLSRRMSGFSSGFNPWNLGGTGAQQGHDLSQFFQTTNSYWWGVFRGRSSWHVRRFYQRNLW